MVFVNDKQFYEFLDMLSFIGEGSQGICYCDKNKVIKIFHDYFEGEDILYTGDDILRFNGIKNSTFIWPEDVVFIKDKVVGYIMPYIRFNNLYNINPLLINLDKLEGAIKKTYDDIMILTDNDIVMYDVAYNILYGNGKIKVIDTLEYGINAVSFEKNRANVDYEIKLFLVDNYFNSFIYNDRLLKEMYDDRFVSSLEFLKAFRGKLSSYLDKDVKTLNTARRLVKRINNPKYIRDLYGDDFNG